MDRLVRFWLSRRVFYDNPMFPLRFVRVDGQEGEGMDKMGLYELHLSVCLQEMRKNQALKGSFPRRIPDYSQ